MSNTKSERRIFITGVDSIALKSALAHLVELQNFEAITVIKGRSMGISTFISDSEIQMSRWKNIGISEEIVMQLRQAGFDCAKAFREFSNFMGIQNKDLLKASDFDSLRRYHAVFPEDSKPTKKQPNFARFQNNFKRRGR